MVKKADMGSDSNNVVDGVADNAGLKKNIPVITPRMVPNATIPNQTFRQLNEFWVWGADSGGGCIFPVCPCAAAFLANLLLSARFGICLLLAIKSESRFLLGSKHDPSVLLAWLELRGEFDGFWRNCKT